MPTIFVEATDRQDDPGRRRLVNLAHAKTLRATAGDPPEWAIDASSVVVSTAIIDVLVRRGLVILEGDARAVVLEPRP